VNKALKKNSDIPDDIKSKGFRKLFIGGLRRSTSNDDLVQYFSKFGKIVNAYVIINPDTGLSKSNLCFYDRLRICGIRVN